MYKNVIKRIFDIVFSAVAIALLIIPMIIIAVVIKLDSPGPAIFKQERIGLNGKVFNLYKFRSMCINAEHMGSGVYSGKDDFRVTRVGKFLRASSFDEFPQFFNIFCGNMSFVGERGIIETTKKNIGFSRVVAVNSISS